MTDVMLNFTMNTKAVEGGLLWELSGDLDLQVVPMARAELDLIEADPPALLIIDLTGLSFMDSTGLGLIAAAYNQAVKEARRCVVVRPRQPVDKAFSQTGLADLIENVQTLDEIGTQPRGTAEQVSPKPGRAQDV